MNQAQCLCFCFVYIFYAWLAELWGTIFLLLWDKILKKKEKTAVTKFNFR